MKMARAAMFLLLAFVLIGCNRNGSSSGNKGTNLSIVVWSPFPPATNQYRHLEHLQLLQSNANALIATNPAFFSKQSEFRGMLAKDSLLRGLIGIPDSEPAVLNSWSESGLKWGRQVNDFCIVVSSPKTGQQFGQIELSLNNGKLVSIYDVESLYAKSFIEMRVRQIIGTREEALRLFANGNSGATAEEKAKAKKQLLEALFLPPDANAYIQMSAPGGSNEGQGYLTMNVLSSNNEAVFVVHINYPSSHSILREFGLLPRSYHFGGVQLFAAWTNVNTQGFLLDEEGFPYLKAP
jgi:hypothetical protein